MRETAKDEVEVFQAVGGSEQPFYDLVDAFYRRVEADPPLRSLYPIELGPGKQHLAWFLIQRFGGPQHFNAQRGAPMLRRRHAEFQITPDQATRWMQAMERAIDDTPQFVPDKALLLRYFEDAALFLVNHDSRETAAGVRSLALADAPIVE